MKNKINNYIWSQLGASLDMLENAINLCPEKVWYQNKSFSDFWYITYHTLFWLDFNMTESPEDFIAPKNIGETELDPKGILPEKVFSKEELKSYLKHCRIKCKTTIENLNEESINKDYKFGTIELTFFELLLYSMRHVQHHTGQLNLKLRQKIDSAPRWVKAVNNKLG
jgi:hypothetical protein